MVNLGIALGVLALLSPSFGFGGFETEPVDTELGSERVEELNFPKALVLADASNLAYTNVDTDTPSELLVLNDPAYEFVQSWTGVDAILGIDRTEEIFGAVFRTKTAPYRYVFAFRGTSSTLDMLDDIGVAKVPFQPFDVDVDVPADVLVEGGFFDVYTWSKTSTPSMQTQLFTLIDQYQDSDEPIDELWITGHSLGASLSVIFSLDIALSRPHIRASNLNFACPKTGNAGFAAFYGQQDAEQYAESRTVRVRNVYDEVPCVPPGYQHVNAEYFISFYKTGFDPVSWIVHRHSIASYQAVLECAAISDPQVCVNGELPAGVGLDYNIHSKVPDPSKACNVFF